MLNNQGLPEHFKGLRFYSWNNYLRGRYGVKVYKVTVDAGFLCPNRDGTVGQDGCIYCYMPAERTPLSVKQQLLTGIEALRKLRGAQKFIAYFQSFSNTYAPVKTLKKLYDNILGLPDIVGLAIGTRPDCVPEETLDLIQSYSDRYEVWMEYGLQSIHPHTLRAINRGHELADFYDALERTRRRKLKVCVHVILGLPGETRAHMVETAKALGALRPEGVKIHSQFVMPGTKLAGMLEDGRYQPLTLEQYVNKTCDFLEYQDPATVIQRLTGDGPPGLLIAPLWSLDKRAVVRAIEAELERRDTYQGYRTLVPA